MNRPVTMALAETLAEHFVEALFAPGYDEGAAELLAKKPNLRILEHGWKEWTEAGYETVRPPKGREAKR